MMDILTVLLLFLLKSFVVEGEVVTPAPGVELPSSESRETLTESVVVAISDAGISVGGEIVARWQGDFSSTSNAGQNAIARLAQHLESSYSQHEALAVQRGTTSAPLKVTIQGDRTMPFALLQQVMLTCSESGYEDIALAVLQG
jgi:biopolymer transport protein ExbD